MIQTYTKNVLNVQTYKRTFFDYSFLLRSKLALSLVVAECSLILRI